MAFKYIVFATVLVAANAGFIADPAATGYSNSLYHGSAFPYIGSSVSYATPVAQYSYGTPAAHLSSIHHIVADQRIPYHNGFQYTTQNHDSGETSRPNEVPQGDSVTGSYPIGENDGSRRVTVGNTADEPSGFNAIVPRESTARPVAGNAVTPSRNLAHASPVAHYFSSPVPQYSTVPVVPYTTYPAPAQILHH